jgi:hypothetical protein
LGDSAPVHLVQWAARVDDGEWHRVTLTLEGGEAALEAGGARVGARVGPVKSGGEG